MQSFRNLRGWEKAHHLTLDVYSSTKTFRERNLRSDEPDASSFRIHWCEHREGCCRKGDTDMNRFLQMAMGLCERARYHCVLARDLEFLKNGNYERLSAEVIEVKRMLAR